MKTCLITGTTHGIGTVTARAIANHGYRVVMACRNLERAAAVRDQIVADTNNSEIHLIECDLSSLRSVRTAAQTFLAEHGELHLLVNNGATMTGQPELSVDGFELMFATNHLGPFLLTRLLLERIQNSAPARIVNVASISHYQGKLDLDDIRTLETFAPLRTYARSKLGNVLFTLALARRLAGQQITVNCLHPGSVATNIIPTDSLWMRIGGPIAKPFMRSAARGAKTSLYLALADDVEGVTGRYFNQNQAVKAPSKLAQDEPTQERLWAFSSELCGLPATF